jgi:dTDP-4-dehydrorhamnose reductase
MSMPSQVSSCDGDSLIVPMKILLFGADGQLGWQLRRSLGVVGNVTALARGATPCGDFADLPGIARTVRELRPDAIVNAAAYTAVDRAESEPGAAFAVNHAACEVLAVEAARLGAWLVHYSTEYVFDGSGQAPWRETDATAPLNAYGRSKLAGEQAIAEGCPRHLVLRTSWLFDTWGDNFLKWLLGAARQRTSLDIVADQWGAPTRAALVADVTAHLLRTARPELAGIYHVAASGEASRHGYAVFALECAAAFGLPLQVSGSALGAVPSSAFPTPAVRPANSRLDTARLRHAFGLELPPWQDGVRAVVAEIATARGVM